MITYCKSKEPWRDRPSHHCGFIRKEALIFNSCSHRSWYEIYHV